MNTMTNRQNRPLTDEEIDAVAGGLTAAIWFGTFQMRIDADANGYQVNAHDGDFAYRISQN